MTERQDLVIRKAARTSANPHWEKVGRFTDNGKIFQAALRISIKNRLSAYVPEPLQTRTGSRLAALRITEKQIILKSDYWGFSV